MRIFYQKTMKRLTIILLMHSLVCYTGVAQNANKNRGTANSNSITGFSADRLQKLDNAMSDWVLKGWMNGGVAL